MCSLAGSLLSILAVLFPPAVAHIKTGRKDLVLNIILTLFAWVPGIIHAWYLIATNPGNRHEQHHHNHRHQHKEGSGGTPSAGSSSMNEYVQGPFVDGPHVEAQSPVYVPTQPQPQLRAEMLVDGKDGKMPPVYGR